MTEPPEPDQEQTAAPVVPEGERRMSPLRWAAVACFVVAVLAALVPVLGLAGSSGDSSAAPQRSTQAADQTTTSTSAKTTTKKTTTTKKKSATKKKSTAKRKASKTKDPAGEVDAIDPDSTTRADSEKLRTKLMVGGAAVVLAGLVFFGRRARWASAKRARDQAKGK